MKQLLPLLALFLPSLASAQKVSDYTPIEKAPYTAVMTMPGFRHLADTSGKAATTISSGSPVTVIGQASPKWAVIERNYLTFYVPQAALGLRGIDALTTEARIKEPLPHNPDTGSISYAEVVQMPGASKNELYARGKVWFARAFNSAQNVIQADDKEAGILVGKAFNTVYLENLGQLVPTRVWYTVALTFKDGRYKQEISDFKFQTEPSATYPEQPVISAEQAVAGTQKDGKPTTWASRHRRALVGVAAANALAIQAGMKSSTGTDW
jgi:Domain of unknown function (DUF4468) with TBP-like fold